MSLREDNIKLLSIQRDYPKEVFVQTESEFIQHASGLIYSYGMADLKCFSETFTENEECILYIVMKKVMPTYAEV